MSEHVESQNIFVDQGHLFPEINPLIERLGEAFFDDLPKSPGVYKMYGEAKHLLYVGKAKNLRRRLFTYKRVKKDSASRKVIRLVRMIREIEYETWPTEEAALLRENELLRHIKPPFNHVNTQPETYYYIGLSISELTASFHLNMKADRMKSDFVYGAFKGHGKVRRALGALLRQLYILHRQMNSPFDFPPVLTRRITPSHYQLELNEQWSGKERKRNISEIKRFLKGTGRTLLDRFNEAAFERDLLDEFIGKIILEDLQKLNDFYEQKTKKNYSIYRNLELDSHQISQFELDDLLIQNAFLEDLDQ